MTLRILKPLLLAAALLYCPASFAQLSLRDDLGRGIFVKEPPRRIVSLAPSLTEMVHAVGAGDLLVGVDSLSNYPQAVQRLPRVGTGTQFSIQQLAPLNPDLVLAWRDGTRKSDIEGMTAFGTVVYVAHARSLDDVPRLLEAIGRLTGRDPLPAMARFESAVDRVRAAYANKLRLATFVEIWNRPLTTASGNHFLTEALDICRADNVFEDLSGFAPTVTIEALASKNPYLIVGAGSASSAEEFRSNWAMRAALAAVKAQRMVYIDQDAIQRPSPRSPEAIERLCEAIDRVRTGWTAKAPAQVEAGTGLPLAAPAPVNARDAGPERPERPSRAVPASAAAPAPTPAPAAEAKPSGKPKPARRPPSQYGM